MNSLVQKMKLQHKPASLDQSVIAVASRYGHATYSYKEGLYIYTVDGVIRDLSETGCSIRGTIPQVVGSKIRIRLCLSDQLPPLPVNGAIISWFAGGYFHVKFPKLKPNDLLRLQQYLCKVAA
jgi:hypothetical protein